MLSPEWLQWFTTNYNQLQDQLQDNYNQLEPIRTKYNPITINYTMIYNQLQDDYSDFQPITIQLQPITTNYNQLQGGSNPITINYKMICNKILGTVHNGLSTKAEGLLTKVQATGGVSSIPLNLCSELQSFS